LKDAEQVFANIAPVMRPSATLCIHLPLYGLPTYPTAPIVKQLHRLSKLIGLMKANIDRAQGKRIMRGLWYEREELLKLLRKLGLIEIETHGFHMSSIGSWHEIVLARKGRS
jgi:hypothetical protein